MDWSKPTYETDRSGKFLEMMIIARRKVMDYDVISIDVARMLQFA